MSSPNRSSSRSKNNPDPADELRRRSRRRLVGAVIMFLAAIIVIPALVETEPNDTPSQLELVLPEKPTLKAEASGAGQQDAQPAPLNANQTELNAQAKNQNDKQHNSPNADEPFVGVPPLVADVAEEPSHDDVAEIPPLPMPTPKLEPKPKTETAKTEAPKKEATAKPPVAKPAEKTAEKPKPPTSAENKPTPKAKPETDAGLDDIGRLAKAATEQTTSESAKAGSESWYVQIAAVRDKTRAEGLQSTLKSKGFSNTSVQTVQSPDGPIYRVRVGPVKGQDAADGLKAKLASAGHSGRITP